MKKLLAFICLVAFAWTFAPQGAVAANSIVVTPLAAREMPDAQITADETSVFYHDQASISRYDTRTHKAVRIYTRPIARTESMDSAAIGKNYEERRIWTLRLSPDENKISFVISSWLIKRMSWNSGEYLWQQWQRLYVLDLKTMKATQVASGRKGFEYIGEAHWKQDSRGFFFNREIPFYETSSGRKQQFFNMRAYTSNLTGSSIKQLSDKRTQIDTASPNGKYLVTTTSGIMSGTLWRTDGMKRIKTAHFLTGASGQISNDGTRLFSGYEGSYVITIATGKLVKLNPTASVALSPNSSKALLLFGDHTQIFTLPPSSQSLGALNPAMACPDTQATNPSLWAECHNGFVAPTISTATAVSCKYKYTDGVRKPTVAVNAVLTVKGGNWRELRFDTGYENGVIHDDLERVFNSVWVGDGPVPKTVQESAWVNIDFTAMNGLPSSIYTMQNLTVTIDMSGVTCK